MRELSVDKTVRIVAVIVAFNPKLSLFCQALDSIKNQVDGTFVIDNGSDNVDLLEEICTGKKCKFISLRHNYGIAYAYNKGFELARNAEAEWVVTCDQDSIMPAGMIDRFFIAAENYGSTQNLGIVCPNFINRTTNRKEYDRDIPAEIDECISSGSMTSVSAWNAVNGFDEVMFIDGVDFDFCKRIRDIGYQILLVPNVCIEHEIGDARIRKILGHEILVLNHSAFRKYFIAQNIIYMSGKQHGGHIELVAYLKVIKQILLTLLYEQNKSEKLLKIARGAMHGKHLLKAARDKEIPQQYSRKGNI